MMTLWSDDETERARDDAERVEIPTKTFAYSFLEGPMESPEALLSDWHSGNCRRAVQWYLYKKKSLFLTPEQVLLPRAYLETGTFTVGDGEPFRFDLLVDGDIIYAERIQNARGETIDTSRITFASHNEYLIALHTAIYTGENSLEIWHATPITGGACGWDVPTFLRFYKPIAAKRV